MKPKQHMIHKSHSKNDLLKLIHELRIDLGGRDITTLQSCNKRVLTTHLCEWLQIKGTFKNPQNYMCLHTKGELIEYMQQVNPKKVLSVQQKKEVMMACTQINHFSDNNFNCAATSMELESKEHIYLLADHVALYGDIPSCRKCISKLMRNPNKLRVIHPTMSKIVRHELDQKQKLKTNYYNSLTISRTRCVVVFD